MRAMLGGPVIALLIAALESGAAAAPPAPTAEAAASHADPLATAMEEIDRLVTGAITTRAMPGASVAIAFDDGWLLSRHYGVASLQNPIAVTSSTRFRIGSVSKLVTALAILKLIEEGRLELDAPVASFLASRPEIARFPATVTVRRLLNHTSGLPDLARSEVEAKVAEGSITDDDYRSVLQRPLKAEPGSEWTYADLPFRILSDVVERASGLPYGRYVAERLAPAMSLSSLRVCEPGAIDHASGYLSHNGRLEPEPAYSIRGLLGEGGLCATTEDLARLLRDIVARKWISESSLTAMTSPTRLSGGQLIDYGFGVRGGWVGQTRAWGHTGGGLHGSWASVAYYPERLLTVAVMANGTGSDVDAATLQAAVAAAVLRQAAPANRPVDSALAAAVAGAYRHGDARTCVIRGTEGLTRVRLGSTAPPTALLHQGSGHFSRSDFPLDRIVFQVDGNRAEGYSVYYDGFFAEYWNRGPQATCDG